MEEVTPETTEWQPLSAVSDASSSHVSTSPRDRHSFVQIKASGDSCNVCGSTVATDGFFLGLECTGCRVVIHEACRGMLRTKSCSSPRAGSNRKLPAFSDADGGAAGAAPGKAQVSSPRDLLKVKHISFRAATGEFTGLDASDDLSLFFGAPLAGQPRVVVKGYADRIPIMLVLLAQELDKRGGLEAEGIFRLSAESSALEDARDALNAGLGVGALAGDPNPHLFAALIKVWFRSLPHGASLLCDLTPEALAACAKAFAAKEAGFPKRFLETDEFLKEPHRSVFVWILDVMAIVCAREAKNKMSDRAISIVFAPSLWEAPADMPPLQAMNAVKDVATLISHSLAYVIATGAARKPFAVRGV